MVYGLRLTITRSATPAESELRSAVQGFNHRGVGRTPGRRSLGRAVGHFWMMAHSSPAMSAQTTASRPTESEKDVRDEGSEYLNGRHTGDKIQEPVNDCRRQE